MKIISWNVNGIRAVAKKDFFEQIKRLNPDILCLQETKAQDDQVHEALAELKGYHIYTNSAVKKGYSGTAIISKTKPLAVFKDINIEEHDQEGRVLTAEFDDFYLTVQSNLLQNRINSPDCSPFPSVFLCMIGPNDAKATISLLYINPKLYLFFKGTLV